ncbi:MAG: hypothetical protein NXI31_13115 [bacterium]|nr:hypothetical protein [bacterium]
MKLFRSLVAVLAFVGAPAAQDVVLQNLASVARKSWVDVAVPAVDAVNLPRLCRFVAQAGPSTGWLAYRGKEVGQHSVMFHVLADLGPNQRVSGRFVPVTNDPTQLPPWYMSDWVADDTYGVLPLPVVLDVDGIEHRLDRPSFELVEDVSPARRVFRLSGRVGSSPIVFEAYLYVYVGQDSVDMECTFTCSDPRMTGMSFDFNAIWLESGEFPHLDYRTRLGVPRAVIQNHSPSHPSYGRWVQLVRGGDSLGRGEGIFLTGAMQCFVAPGRPHSPLSYGSHGMGQDWSVADRVDALFARGDKPTVGVWQDWDDKWLAFGMVPEVPVPFRNDGGTTDSNAQWAWFQALMRQPADLFADRPRGLHKYAGSSGAQEDFGACKGSFAVTVGDPRWIYDAGYSVAEVMMRGFHYREISGRPMRFANHPALQCFSQRPNCLTTGDTLGTPCPRPFQWSTNGWSTFDDQHRSQNNFNALLALTGRYALVDQLRDLVEVDLAMVPNWMDSPRGEGRLLMALANMLLLLDDPAKRQELQAAMLRRIQVVRAQWLGARFVGRSGKPVRAMQVGSDGSFLEPGTNQRVPALIVWEHSIAVMGFFAAWRTTGDSRFLDLAQEVSKTVVNHCVFRHGGQWHAATAVRYLTGDEEGNALPASTYYPGSPDVHVGLNFWPWVLPAVLICREVHTGVDPQLVTRCNTILQSVVPNGPTNWLDAEWWAVLPR